MDKNKDLMKTKGFKLFERYSYLEVAVTFIILLAAGAGFFLKK